MLKFKLTISVIILFACFSCNTKQSEKFDSKIIDMISKEDPSYPSVFTPVFFFGKCEDDKIAILHVQELKMIHQIKYKNLSFKDFIEQALNQKIIVNYNHELTCFDINLDVDKVYNEDTFNDFMKQFCDVIDSRTILLKRNIPKDQKKSIFYFFFRHNYLSYFDDRTGRYYLRSTTDITAK
jgi:hypothetical protein